MSTTLVPFDTLCQTLGFTRAGEVARCLRKQGIKFFLGKGGAPWTTMELINAAGGVTVSGPANDEPYSASIVIPQKSR